LQPTAETARLGQALNQLAAIAFGFVHSQALHTAFSLGVFEALAGAAMTADELASRVKAHPTALRRLLVVLAHLDLLTRDGPRFRNSELGQFCSSRAAVNIGKVTTIDPFYHMFEYLTDAVRHNRPQWETALDTTPGDAFTALYADPHRLREFAKLMNAFSVPQGRLIAESFDFSDRTCIMDVAGGPGGQAIEIGLRYPHLRGIITDMEAVCVVAREDIELAGLSTRFTAVAADLLTGPYPDGADVIVLGHVLHDWSDETCLRILRNCRAALPIGGVLLISDSVLGDDFSGTSLDNLKDLIMLVANEPDARERTRGEFESLLAKTGFELREVIRLDAPRDLLVARKLGEGQTP
jgi:SAM-dependent methyltransferase